MRKDPFAQPTGLPPLKAGQRSNLGGSAEQGAGSRRLRWWVGVAAALAVLASLIAVTRPDANSIEGKVNRLLEPTRRDERNQKWFYQQAARLDEMPQPLPKLGRWIRDEDPDREDPSPEEILELGEEAGPVVLRLLEHDPSPGVRQALCEVVIEFSGIDPLPALTNLVAADANFEVRAAAATAAAEYAPDRAATALLSALAREREAEAPSLDYALINVLPKLGTAHALKPLVEMVRSTPPPAFQHRPVMAANALGELGGKEAIIVLRSALDPANPELSAAAARALAKLGDRESLPRLIEHLAAQVSTLRTSETNVETVVYTIAPQRFDAQFVEELGKFQDPAFVPLLLEALELCQQWERDTIINALAGIGDERALKPMVATLNKSRDKWERSQTITAISKISGTNTLPALIGILTNYPENATDVVSAISRLSGESATAQLRELFHQSTGRVREAIAHSLGMSGHAEALPVLLEAIDSGDDEARKAAAQALGMIADPRAVPALLTALKDSTSDVRQEAAWALGYIADPAGTAGLIAALKDAEFSVRFAAAFALAGIQDPAAVEPLKALLPDKERRVQIAAACSLTFHASDAGFEKLRASLRSRSEDWHRFAAIVGLLRLNTPAARDALGAAPAEVKQRNLQTFREMGLDDGAVGALIWLLQNGDDDERHYAARVLPFFRDPATVGPLRAATHDQSSEVRSAARVAAVQIERYTTAKVGQ